MVGGKVNVASLSAMQRGGGYGDLSNAPISSKAYARQAQCMLKSSPGRVGSWGSNTSTAKQENDTKPHFAKHRLQVVSEAKIWEVRGELPS